MSGVLTGIESAPVGSLSGAGSNLVEVRLVRLGMAGQFSLAARAGLSRVLIVKELIWYKATPVPNSIRGGVESGYFVRNRSEKVVWGGDRRPAATDLAQKRLFLAISRNSGGAVK